jgi:hypothetical protein
MDDLLARFPKQTPRAIQTKAVFHGQKEWFLRLDFCSTEDTGGDGGAKHTSTPHNRGCASVDVRFEACNPSIRRYRPKKVPRPTRLLLIPHNKCMDHPSLASAQKGAEKVLASTKSIHSEILAHAAALSDQNGATEDAH